MSPLPSANTLSSLTNSSNSPHPKVQNLRLPQSSVSLSESPVNRTSSKSTMSDHTATIAFFAPLFRKSSTTEKDSKGIMSDKSTAPSELAPLLEKSIDVEKGTIVAQEDEEKTARTRQKDFNMWLLLMFCILFPMNIVVGFLACHVFDIDKAPAKAF